MENNDFRISDVGDHLKRKEDVNPKKESVIGGGRNFSARRPIGRPMKYKHLIEALDDETLYTPSTIVLLAETLGFLGSRGEGDTEERKLEKRRIRIAMGRFSNNHDFPDEGDGFITLRGQSPTPAWFGWRWKEALNV